MKKQGFVLGSVILAASAVIVKLIGAFFRIPLAALLGGTGMGYFSCAYGIFLPVYAVAVTGIPAAAARAAAEDIAVNGGNGIRRIKLCGMLIFGGAGLMGTLVIAFGAYPFCKYAIGNMPALPAVIMIAPTVMFGCPAAILRGCYEGMNNMLPTALSQLAEALVKLAAGLGGAYYVMHTYYNSPERFMRMLHIQMPSDSTAAGEIAVSYAAAAACGAISLSVLAGLAVLIIYDRAAVRESRGKNLQVGGKPFSRIASELASVAVPASMCALVTNITSMIDLATIMRSLEKAAEKAPEYFSMAEDTANFYYGSFAGLALTVFNLVPSVTNMFGKAMLPRASAAYAAGDREKLSECSLGLIKTVTYLAVPCGIGISVLAAPVLNALFSGSPREAAAAARPLSAMGSGIIFLCIASASFPLFQAAGRQDIPVKLMAVAAAVKAAGNLIMVPVPQLNITGAAIATDLSYGVVVVPSVMMLRKCCGLNVSGYMRFAAGSAVCGLLCGGTAWLVYSGTAHMGVLASVIISSLAGGAVYIISTYFSGIIDKSTLKMLISQKNPKNT